MDSLDYTLLNLNLTLTLTFFSYVFVFCGYCLIYDTKGVCVKELQVKWSLMGEDWESGGLQRNEGGGAEKDR